MRTWRTVASGVAALFVIYLGIEVARAARSLSDSACQNPNPTLRGWQILLACVAFFTIGHYTATRRAPHHGVSAFTRSHWWNGSLAVHTALAIFFACGFAALAYETVGVWADNPWGLQPITTYVRCARSHNPVETMLIAVTLSFFAGHWLWFPRRRRDPA